jgi:hypothetical protein
MKSNLRKLTALGGLVAALSLPLGAAAQNMNGSTASAPPASGMPSMGPAEPGEAQVPQPASNSVNWQGVGVGAGTLATNVVYIPAKLVYGLLGGIAGGAGYVLTGGNKQVSNTIWRSSLGGDYVVTPDMLRGKDQIHFSGPVTTPSEDNSAAQTPQAPANTYSMGSSSSGSNSGGSSSGSMNAATSSPSVPPPAPSSYSGAYRSHPIDSGAGPVKGTTSSSHSGSANAPSGLPDTTIE